MIELAVEQWAGIECLHAAPAGQRALPLPTILFYHGFTSSKEVYSYFAVALAQAGFRVVMPDADRHGARYDGDSEARLHHFWDILRHNIDELPRLERALKAQGMVAPGKLAVAGASMGGMTALGAMARYPQLHSVACLMGSAWFMSLSQTLFPPLPALHPDFAARMAPLADYDPSQHLAALGNRPLLLWHGEADELVPATESVRLQEALRAQSLDTQLTWLTEKQIGHKITPAALSAAVDFFTRSL